MAKITQKNKNKLFSNRYPMKMYAELFKDMAILLLPANLEVINKFKKEKRQHFHHISSKPVHLYLFTLSWEHFLNLSTALPYSFLKSHGYLFFNGCFYLFSLHTIESKGNYFSKTTQKQQTEGCGTTIQIERQRIQ